MSRVTDRGTSTSPLWTSEMTPTTTDVSPVLPTRCGWGSRSLVVPLVSGVFVDRPSVETGLGWRKGVPRGVVSSQVRTWESSPVPLSASWYSGNRSLLIFVSR